MIFPAVDPAADPSPEALLTFLRGCRAQAGDGKRLVSISLEVDALDPLAVLESIFEPAERHFYVERPAEGFAVAGAEAVLAFQASGAGRFEACQRFIDETLAGAIAVGDLAAPFAGPHFFLTFAFHDTVEAGEPFEAASVFVPRWQVGRRESRTVAVANLLVDRDSPVEAMAERVLRAHSKFQTFDYGRPEWTEQAASVVGPPLGTGGEEAYLNAVARATAEIASGAFEKIVLARVKDRVADRPIHPLRVLNTLRERFPDCYAFSAANGRGPSFIGASPERLLRVEEGRLLTEALAGSMRRGDSASEDAALAAQLLKSDKELREQRMVLDSIVRSLSPLGMDLRFPARPLLKRLANVQHLDTPVRAVLPARVRLLDVLARLHPTPAVGGSPREVVIGCIRGYEGFPRGLYAGTLGWIDARGGGEFLVGLRSALIDGTYARMYAGAGIVAGSSPERELAETDLKFEAMERALFPRGSQSR